VIFRCTPQWFVPMDKPLAWIDPRRRRKALGERRRRHRSGRGNPAPRPHPARARWPIEETRFVPEKGRNRIGSMVEGRPDWVLSRQRAWGVPITLFVRLTGEYLVDPRSTPASSPRCARRASMPGTTSARRNMLGPDYNPDDYERSPTFSTSGSIRAAPMPSCSKAGAGRSCNGRPTSISKAPTSIAAGSSPRC
jgi:isoleucyl-tRNA synthetase